MKDLIKAIRTAANMNQEQFASSLGTTPLSINRWENGKTLPNRMAQTQLYNFCKERSIDVAKLIVDTKAYADTDNKLILYHGSKKGITGDVAPISREECDFGRGFYMGTSTLQPLTLICNEDKPKFYAVELDLTGLKVLTVDVGMDWAMLIAYHRKEMESAKGTAVHVMSNAPTHIGSYVTIGHNAVIHCSKVGDNTLIGMGAILLGYAEIGHNSVIGAGSLVTEHKKLPNNSMLFGSPVKVVRA